MIDDFERKTFGTPSAENDNTGTTVTNQDS